MDTQTKILARTELARRSRELRESGRRLVLTNGCFDLLHAGHVRYLEAARSLGDALAVAVNSDASTRALKGPGRPVNSEEDRAAVVAGLEAVSYVVIFAEPTAADVVDEIRPAIYVKGGDYAGDPSDPRYPVEGHHALAYGGEVRILPFLPGRSTTGILRKLADGQD